MRNRIIICLGLSLSVLTGTFALWGGLRLSTLTGLGISEILKYWSIPLLLAMGSSLFLVLVKRRVPSQSFLTMTSIVSGVLVIAGYALLYFFGTTVGSNVLVVCGSAALIGVGYGFMLLLWQHHLSQFSQDGVIKILLLSLAISSAGYLVPLLLLRDFAWYAFPFVVLMAVIFCLIAVYLPPLREDEICPPQSRRLMAKEIARELRDPLICVSAIAFAVALTRAIALDGIDNSDMVNIAESISIIIVSVILYLIWFVFGKSHSRFGKLNILGLYRVSFPIIATALLSLSIGGSSLGLAVTTLVYTVFSLVSAFIMSTSISIAREHKIWSSHVYGVFAGAMYFVFALATTLGAWVYYPQNFGAATFSVIVLVVLYILAMSYVAIQNRRKKSDVEGESSNPVLPDVVSETRVIDEVEQRCSILAERNVLTSRERDTLLLLARGRDVPSIAKQLFISENTVRSHSKGVYRKLKIHSKQELLDLLETIPLD